MMQRFWSRLAVQLGKHAYVVGAVTVVITVAAGFGLPKLQFETGQDSYLNPDDKVYQDSVAYQDLFGGQAMLVLLTADEGTSIVDLMSPANLEELDRIEQELSARTDLVVSVITPKAGLAWSDALIQSPDGNPTSSIAGKALLSAIEREPDAAAKELRTADSLTTLERLNAIAAENRVLERREWVDFLLHDNRGEIRKSLRPVFPDEQHAQIVVRLTGNSDLDTEGAGAVLVRDTIAGAKLEGATVTVTGAPVLLKEINDYLQGGLLTLGGIAVVAMVVILLTMFDVRWRLLPLGVVVIGVTWAFGLAGYLGIPLSLVTIAGLPILLGVGIDYAIQMHSRVEEEVIIARESHPIQASARNLGPALLVVTFDAVFSFAALRFALVPMIRDFGILLAIGITVICFGSIILPLAALGIREYRSPTTGRDFSEGITSKLVVKLGQLPPKVAPAFAAVSLLVLLGGVAVEGDLEIQTDPVQWLNQDSDAIRDFNDVQTQTGSSSELGVFIRADDVFTDDAVQYVFDYATYGLTNHPDDLLTASSVVTTVAYVLEIPGATPLAPTGADVRAAWEAAPAGIRRSMVTEDGTAANLVFRYGTAPLQDRGPVINDLDDQPRPEGIEATPSGLAVVGVGLLENIERNRAELTYYSIAFVGVFLAIRLRSVVRSLLSLVPVLIGVGASSLVAFAFAIKLSPMTAVGGPLVVAVCTEFTSLILLRYVEERGRGLSPAEATDVAAARTGRAFIVSAITGIAGVVTIASSRLPLLRGFGLVVALNVTVALLSALVILPPLLVWADERGWVSKGMIPDDVLKATTPKLARSS